MTVKAAKTARMSEDCKRSKENEFSVIEAVLYIVTVVLRLSNSKMDIDTDSDNYRDSDSDNNSNED